jgi:nucleoside-diphosphate-sugar epimerase
VKVLVTGASGFIGQYVVENLVARGIDVIAFDHKQVKAELAGVEQYLGDVRDATAVQEAVAISDGVIHLSGVLGTAETIDNPMPAIETNTIGSLNVFDAVRRYKRRAVYITVGNYWFNNTYSITKTAAEQLAWMFNKEHKTEIAVVRALNAYGPRQKAEPVRKIMPNFILPALQGRPITIYGDGEQVMDMIHVRDVAEVLVRALLVDHGRYAYTPERYIDNKIKFEAGTGRITTVNDIAKVVLDQVGGGVINHVPMRGGEPDRSMVIGDPATLADLYESKTPELISLEDGVRETIQWYRNLLNETAK